MLWFWIFNSTFPRGQTPNSMQCRLSCCFLWEAQDRDPRKAEANLGPGMYKNFPGAAIIVSLFTWLRFWDSPAPRLLSAARPGWLVRPKTTLTRWLCSAAPLPVSPALAASPPALFPSLPLSQSPAQPHQLRAQWITIPCPHFSPDTLCL